MNKITDLPFNVTLLDTNMARLARLRPTSVTDINDGDTDNFHEDGLYSTLTYGRAQSKDRFERFSYVELNTELFHPFIFRQIVKMKSYYKEIISGKRYGIWDNSIKDIVVATEAEGEKGYAFFARHYKNIKFRETGSGERKLRIDLLDKFRDRSMIKRHIIIPAGLRELEVSETGRVTEDPINDLYRRLIAIARTIQPLEGGSTSNVYDAARWSLQLTAEDIFDHLYKMVTGKKGFIQGKYAKRRVFDSTRNVITSMDTTSMVMNDDRQLKVTDTLFGLYQTMRGVLPLTIHQLRNRWLDNVFSEGTDIATLIDPKTLKSEEVKLTVQEQDRWVTTEGLERLVSGFSYLERRHNPVTVQGRYVALIYIKGDHVKVFGDIDMLPPDFNSDNVHPMTWGELYYYTLAPSLDEVYSVITRYPVTGMGSTYVSRAYVKTTTVGLLLKELNQDWIIDDGSFTYKEWPDSLNRLPWIDSMSPASSRLVMLGADFDGDTCSATFLYSDEAKAECKKVLESKDSLLSPDGKIYHGMITDLSEWVLWNMSATD